MADQRHVFMLDTLLDTRLATISKLNPELATKIVADPETYGKYINRPNDLFAEFGFSLGEFEEEYSKRDVTTLMTSLPTNFLFEMAHIAASLVNLKAQEPHNVENIDFVINTYPYTDLTSAEQERILDAISARLQVIVRLSSICQPPAAMSPTNMRGNQYNAIYFYDFREWLKEHYHKDRVTEETVGLIPGICIYTVPHFDDLDQLREAAEYQNPNGENTNPIVGMQVMFSPFFRLELMPIELYSLVRSEKIADDATGK